MAKSKRFFKQKHDLLIVLRSYDEYNVTFVLLYY